MRWVISLLIYFWLAFNSQAGFPFSFWSPSVSSGGNQCLIVTFHQNSSPPGSFSVTLQTLTAGAHIFYKLQNDSGADPAHMGDTASSGTTRIGSNSGTLGIADNGHDRYIRAVAYKSGMTDSAITEFVYNPPGP